MIFKNKNTMKRYTLNMYDLDENLVILKDKSEFIVMTIKEFYNDYEYVWMPSKA